MNPREVTWTTACEASEVAASIDGQDVYFMTDSTEDARAFIQDCARWVGCMSQLVPDTRTSTGEFRIDFASGCSIYAMPTQPDRMRGKKKCYAILECSSTSDVEGWLTAASWVIKWGGRVAIVGSEVCGKFADLVASIKDGETTADLHEIEATRVPAVA